MDVQSSDEKVIGSKVPFEVPPRNKETVTIVARKLFFELVGKDQKATFIGWSEFSRLCQWAKASTSAAEKLWNVSDKDRSGTLSRQEFFEFCAIPEVWPDVSKLVYLLERNDYNTKRDVAKHLFLFLDKDNDGKLSFTEFFLLCKAAGELDRNRVKSMWESASPSIDAHLSFDKFANFVQLNNVWPTALKIHQSLAALSTKQSREKLTKVATFLFDKLDGNPNANHPYSKKDGILDINEFKLFAQKAKASTKQCEEMFKKFDVDGSRALSKGEFSALLSHRDVWPVAVKVYSELTGKGYTTV
eukprot:CAMPEP_0184497728 /NCGR_PEP_ID=MMETSP0113_2-20130426/37293_1 /TAXON_ID=91329 /ORGANISM="Norrisiella sphaerica, Strain BC52" /LENGTH=301 /DNA_ID=CAMNT_0026884963 /DNA_START=60 /DNA_END=965 /DNA_ORIENTATION=-